MLHKRRSALAWGAPIVALLITAVGYNSIRRAGEFGATAERSDSVRSVVGAIVLNLDDAETGQRGFLLTGDSTYLEPFKRGERGVPVALRSLDSLSRNDRNGLATADSLRKLSTGKFAEMERSIAVRAESGTAAAIAVVQTGHGKRLMDAARRVVAFASRREADRLHMALAEQQRERDFARLVLFGGIVLAVLLGVIANARTLREAAWLAAAVRGRDAANASLQQQATELEAANEELIASSAALQEQTSELEQQTEEAQSLAGKLELTNDELAKANEQLEERSLLAARAENVARAASKAKSDFLAMMSHEIRTPINAVVGYSELLAMELSGPLNEGQRSHVHRIQQTTRHLLQLVNEVLDLAKIESGTLRVDAGKGQIGATVSAALDLVRTQAHAKQITLVDCCGPLASVTYHADEDRVRQVMLNLLSNAVKFTRPGGTVTVSAELRGYEDGTERDATAPCIGIAVLDSGIGIAPENFDRIFEPFTQVETEGRNTYTREQSGTGLGLPISKQLATLMGGAIEVSSAVGAGSKFTLWLPLEARRPAVAETRELAREA